jgi:hypothetical protein
MKSVGEGGNAATGEGTGSQEKYDPDNVFHLNQNIKP